MKIEQEIWKDIEEYSGLYQVSNLGRIKSKNGVLKTRVLFNSTYVVVTLCMYGISEECNVHVLVARAFKGFKSKGFKFVVDHIDENPLNNRADNLRILTSRQNTYRAIDKSKTHSELIGVTWQKHRSKFYSSIKIDRVSIHLGTHETNEKYLNTLYEIAFRYRNLFDGDTVKFRSFVNSIYILEGNPLIDNLITINLKDMKNIKEIFTKGNIRDEK